MRIKRLLISTFVLFAPAFGTPLLVVVPNAQTGSAGNSVGDLTGVPADSDIQLQED
jgi:hypothetical protein